MKLKFLYNPFESVSDKILLFIGVITFGIGTALSWKLQMIFDGIFDIHIFKGITFNEAFAANAIDVIVLCLFLFAAGKLVNPKTRMIDILNASFISRIPVYLTTFLIVFMPIEEISDKIMTSISNKNGLQLPASEIIILLIFSCLSLFLLVYGIALLVNGFRVAANAKKSQHYIIFAIALILAEIISKLIIYYL